MMSVLCSVLTAHLCVSEGKKQKVLYVVPLVHFMFTLKITHRTEASTETQQMALGKVCG